MSRYSIDWMFWTELVTCRLDSAWNVVNQKRAPELNIRAMGNLEKIELTTPIASEIIVVGPT